MAESKWVPTFVLKPNDGVLVETKTDDGHGVRNEADLMRQGDLWFLPDGSTCVYYVPTHWRMEGLVAHGH
jgi:hypothetical protein